MPCVGSAVFVRYLDEAFKEVLRLVQVRISNFLFEKCFRMCVRFLQFDFRFLQFDSLKVKDALQRSEILFVLS